MLTASDRRKIGVAVSKFNRTRPGRHVQQVTVSDAAYLLWRRMLDKLTADDIANILSARVALSESAEGREQP